jgi:glycosyltransferase involved in cell wall biosynthesis
MMFRVPHVITFHGTFDDKTFQGRFVSVRKALIRFLLLRATVLNVVSEDAKSNLIEHFPAMRRHSSRIVVIANGIDVDFFTEEPPNQRGLSDIKGIDTDTFVIGYLGRYMPEKGFPVLIDAIELLVKSPGFSERIRVLALGWGSFIREYQALIRAKEIERCFVFIEFQPDIRWILRQVGVLVIPSLREAFGLIAVEGLVTGTPIIASDCVGLREITRNTPTRMVTAGDANELAKAIMERFIDPRKVEAKAFVHEATKRFDVRATAAALDGLFERASKGLTAPIVEGRQ